MPKYIVVMADQDILESIMKIDHSEEKGNSIEDNINWIIGEFAKLLITRREDLKSKNPGSVTADLTRLIWVKMLARPDSKIEELEEIWSAKSTFNDALEHYLKVEKYMYLMKIPDMEEYKYFDKWGSLSPAGKSLYWKGFNKQLKEIDSVKKPQDSYNGKKSEEKNTRSKKQIQSKKIAPDQRKEHSQAKRRLNYEDENYDRYYTKKSKESTRRRLPSPPPQFKEHSRFTDDHRRYQDNNR